MIQVGTSLPYGGNQQMPVVVFSSEYGTQAIFEDVPETQQSAFHLLAGDTDSTDNFWDFSIETTVGATYGFNADDGFFFDNGGGPQPIYDVYGGLHAATLVLGECTPIGAGLLTDPGSPPTDTVADLGGWCSTLYEQLTSAGFFK